MRDEIIFDDKYKLSDFGFINIYGNEQDAINEITTNSLHIAGRKGKYHFKDELGTFKEKFPIFISEEDESLRNFKIRKLKRFLLDEKGFPRLVKIEKSSEPGIYYWGKLIDITFKTRYMYAQSLVIEFECFDGVKYAKETALNLTWGSEKITFMDSHNFGNTSSGANDLLITGNKEIYPYVDGFAVKPIITLVGSGNNIIIRCGDGYINVGSLDNQTFKIDTKMYVAYDSNLEVIVDMNEFFIYPNKSLSISGSNLNLRLSIDYRDEYI